MTEPKDYQSLSRELVAIEERARHQSETIRALQKELAAMKETGLPKPDYLDDKHLAFAVEILKQRNEVKLPHALDQPVRPSTLEREMKSEVLGFIRQRRRALAQREGKQYHE